MLNQTYGIITNFAGMQWGGYAIDGIVATSARFFFPSGITVDSVGNVYFANTNYNTIEKVTISTGIITRVAGTGMGFGYTGDNGPARAAYLFGPEGVTLDATGNIYIADTRNNVIRKVTKSTGIITTVAGTTYRIALVGYSGDGGLATSARLKAPSSIAFDSYGVMYIADSGNNVIRRVAPSGIISTVAGTGVIGFTANGGAATSARLSNPKGIAFDSLNNLYIADTLSNVIRKVTNTTGIITIVAGTNRIRGSSGNNVLATSAQLAAPIGLAVDSKNNLYFTDTPNCIIRKVTASTGIITTVAGNGMVGYIGDGADATLAKLDYPNGVAIHSSTGNIYITDTGNTVVRKVTSVPL